MLLRDDGMSYGDYVEQLTRLLFLETADERSRPPYNQTRLIPPEYAWPSLLARDGESGSTTISTHSKRWTTRRALP